MLPIFDEKKKNFKKSLQKMKTPKISTKRSPFKMNGFS